MPNNKNNVDLSANIASLNDEAEPDDSSVDSNIPSGNSIASSEDIRTLLNMDNQKEEAKQEVVNSTETINKVGDLPPDLPFMEKLEQPEMNPVDKLHHAPKVPSATTGPLDQLFGPAKVKGGEAYAFFLWMLKNVLPYVVIFLIGLGLYFFYFSDFSINNLFNSSDLTIENVESSNKDLEKLKKDEAGAYAAWMGQFFFEVNDDAIISMDADVSGNGLTNFEKYLLNLNPKVYSTRGNSTGDGAAVLEDINPWTGKPFTDQQKELVNKYINKELISNRITAAALTRGVTKFAQYVSPDSPYYVDSTIISQSNGSSQTTQNGTGSIPSEVASNQTTAQVAPQTGSNNGAINLNSGQQTNQSIAGRLDIPANNISVPITWTKDVKDFDADLKKGLVHYPGTVLPGEVGTSYISGHSSGYLWDKSPYKQVFAILGQVKDGTSFSITVTDNSGAKVIYHYVVERRGEYAADDQAQFVNTADSIVALSTCWPVGTTARRLVLFGKLTQTERQ